MLGLLLGLDLRVTKQPHECLQGLLTSCMQQTDFKSMPSQVICLAAAIKVTQQAEQAIEAGKLPSLQVYFPTSTALLSPVLQLPHTHASGPHLKRHMSPCNAAQVHTVCSPKLREQHCHMLYCTNTIDQTALGLCVSDLVSLSVVLTYLL